MLAELELQVLARLVSDVRVGQLVVDWIVVFQIHVHFGMDGEVVERLNLEASACTSPVGFIGFKASFGIAEVAVVVLQATGESDLLDDARVLVFVKRGRAKDFIERALFALGREEAAADKGCAEP